MSAGVPFTITTPLITIGSGGDITQVKVPRRGTIVRMAVTSSIATPTVDVYNRAFVNTSGNIAAITNDGNTKTQLRMAADFLVRVGDLITVATNTVSGYNTTHRVTRVIDSTHFVTDQTYTADGASGTAVLAISSTEQSLYHVMEQLTLVANKLEVFCDRPYINQDPLNTKIAGNVPLYFKCSAAGTYRISLTIMAPETVGG